MSRVVQILQGLKALCRVLVHGRSDIELGVRARRVLRGMRIAVLILAALVVLQSVLLVVGAWRNDLAIEHNMGVAQAEAAFNDAFSSSDFVEGAAAFLEKRAPRFS